MEPPQAVTENDMGLKGQVGNLKKALRPGKSRNSPVMRHQFRNNSQEFPKSTKKARFPPKKTGPRPRNPPSQIPRVREAGSASMALLALTSFATGEGPVRNRSQDWRCRFQVAKSGIRPGSAGVFQAAGTRNGTVQDSGSRFLSASQRLRMTASLRLTVRGDISRTAAISSIE